MQTHKRLPSEQGTAFAILCDFCKVQTPFFAKQEEESIQEIFALLRRAGWIVEETPSGYPVCVCPSCDAMSERALNMDCGPEQLCEQCLEELPCSKPSSDVTNAKPASDSPAPPSSSKDTA